MSVKRNSFRIQRQLFRENQKELTRGEYHRLLSTAQVSGRERLALLMEAICATGIRVSEVQYLTVEAVKAGKAEISLKGKIRTILIPGSCGRNSCLIQNEKIPPLGRCSRPEAAVQSPESRFGRR